MPSSDFWDDVPLKKSKKIAAPPKVAKKKPLETEEAKGETKDEVKFDVHDLDAISNEPTSLPDAEEESVTAPAPEPKKPKKISFSLLGAAKILGVLVLCAISIIAGLYLVTGQLMNYKALAQDAEPQVVVIERGETTRTIAAKLEDQGVILSRWPFLAYVAIHNLNLKAGTYAISPTMSGRDIAVRLGGGETSSQKITIPEGWRTEQIAAYLAKANIVTYADFMKATTYDPIRYTLPAGVTRNAGDSLTGLLFPDTYTVAYGATSTEIVTMMLNNFGARTKDLGITNADVVLASIVEREAKKDADRPLIASVYTNRLKNNMRLQADPTVQYAKDTAQAGASEDPTTYAWWKPILVSDYTDVQSPYNTYQNLGLPPAPIANPGLKSLVAAHTPAESDNYYFINLKDGSTVYAKTNDEQNANRQKYAGQ